MDIDPIQPLAFSMHARPKLYALLLGSGVSRAAGVLTGWEIVLDLVRKLMVMQGVEAASDPHKWYREEYGRDPDYSTLLGQLAPTPAARQQILRQYFEPNPADETDASKRPTAAHRAIADLVKDGIVKVILTTNFDHLIENALREAGVEPVVLSSTDDITGMMPLDHIDCCVVKLHGDYLDERIRNTADELSEYPAVLNDVLDRILEEYGLVVCGWSGEWDVALSKAIRRAKSRRYMTYWVAYGTLGNEAERIVQAREARTIEVESADRFFDNLSGLVRSIGDHAIPHPLSVQASVAQCKRLLARDEDRIRLADFVDSIGEEALNGLADLPALSDFDSVALTDHIRRYEGVCGKLLAVAVEASHWSRDAQIDTWRNTVERFFQRVPAVGNDLEHAVRSYPAILLTYALGIGAIGAGRPGDLATILAFPTGHEVDSLSGGVAMKTEEDVGLGLWRTTSRFAGRAEPWRSLEGMEGRNYPMNEWLFQSLREHTTRVIPSGARYERVFDRMEVLVSLGCTLRNQENRELPLLCLPGRFVYRRKVFNAIVKEIDASLFRERDKSRFMRFVGDGLADGLEFLESFRDEIERIRQFQHPYS